MNPITWIIVADSTKAKIFSTFKARLLNEKTDANALTLVSEHTHPESRKRDQDLVSDKMGNFAGSTFTEATDPKRHENEVFAKEISKLLSHAHNEHTYRDLILIAPPAFMGMLNTNLSHEVKKLITNTIEKDYTHCTLKELTDHLNHYL
jgi:protein required for attachment to host cells